MVIAITASGFVVTLRGGCAARQKDPAAAGTGSGAGAALRDLVENANDSSTRTI